MALESVDLLTLLKRVRKPVPADAVEETAAAVSGSAEAPLTPPNPVSSFPPNYEKSHEKEELDDLRAELLSDEVLIQRILGLLYRRKKGNPNSGFISILDMERILNIEREGASFVMSYMKTTKIIEMDDKSRMAITVPGIEYLRGVVGLQTVANAGAASVPE